VAHTPPQSNGHGLGADGKRAAAMTVAQTAKPLLTAEELAARWDVPKPHVYRLAREGHLPKGIVVSLGRYYRFRLAGVEEFERDGGTGGETL
jgi:excisionase family DNA binding protein